MFFVFEGADGVGKTTQVKLLAEHISREYGSEVLCVREPGATALGEKVRGILLDPASGDLVAPGVEAQTRQVLTNLKNVLESAGTSLEKVVKTTVFLRDMADFPKMNAIYAEFFTENPPARSTIAVAGLPKSGMVEIEAIALR